MQLLVMLEDGWMNSEHTKAYACYNKRDDIRKCSTSGGMFYLISDYIVNNLHGYVCGAIFDHQFRVKHIIVDNSIDLKKLLGSKYPQSKLGDVFCQIKKLLQEGKTVLFCGTPCQIEALVSFLGGKSDNLWLVDFVCHGVASPQIWDNYLCCFYDKEKIVGIRFKDKIKGWKNWHVCVEYKQRRIYTPGYMDMFMRSYLEKINIRPSCYECVFKGYERISDFTLADCWGIGEKNQRLNDDKGLSALLVHSAKGMQLFDSLSNCINYEEYEPNQLMSANWACISSPERNLSRDKFFSDYCSENFKKVFLSYFRPSFKDKIKHIKRLFMGIDK